MPDDLKASFHQLQICLGSSSSQGVVKTRAMRENFKETWANICQLWLRKPPQMWLAGENETSILFSCGGVCNLCIWRWLW